jgi:hypothetical protein
MNRVLEDGTRGQAAGQENPLPHLQQQHLDDLRKSGLRPETIQAAGFRTVQGAEVNGILNWRGGAEVLGACLYVPYLNRDRTPIGFGRVKPDVPRREPRPDGSVRQIKYEQPKDVGVRVYVPPMVWCLVDDPSRPLVVTEGEKKALAAAQLGFPCVGLGGVDCWSKTRACGEDGRPKGPRLLLDDWQALQLKDRTVFLAYDAERPGTQAYENVRRAERTLALALADQAGASVRIIRLPPPSGEQKKVGLDDYLLTHTAEDLRVLMATAEAVIRPGDVHLSDRGNALRLVSSHGADLRHLGPWRKWQCWDGRRWAPDDTGAVMCRAKDVVARLYRQVTEEMRHLSSEGDN